MGIKVSTDYIRAELAKLWPNLDMVILLDKEFILPKLAEVVGLFKESKIRLMEFIPEFNDCDDFALFLMSEVRLKRYEKYKNGSLPVQEAYPIAFGRVVGDLFRGMGMSHVVNICFTEEGIYFFDITPDSDRYWKADSYSDNILLFEM